MPTAPRACRRCCCWTSGCRAWTAWKLLRSIRADDALKAVPVVILSSSREESDLVRSWDLGANAYVVKPMDIDQFFTAVKTLGTFWALLNQAPEGD